MPTINLTNNTDLNLTASSADDNATLNRYLLSLLTFKTPPSFDPIANLPVKDQKELDFPITLSAAGEGKFAVEKTVLDIAIGPEASLGLLQNDDESQFLSGLKLTSDSSSSGLVSFALQGTLSIGDDKTVGDTTFGIADNTSLTLTSYYQASASDTLGGAVVKAVSALTIPHDLEDLKSLPPGAICSLDAASTLKFSASFTYSFLNDPLAAISISKLPSFAINVTGSVTIEGSASHTSDHTIFLAKLPNGLLHLAVQLTKTDDLEASLTVSAGVGADIGSQDALAFLLDRINPNSAAEAEAIAAQMKDASQFKSDIKSAIDTALSSSLAVSLKAALDNSTARNRAFLYQIDLNELDQNSQAALTAALTGDFTALTKPGSQLAGIQLLDSALTVTATHTHTLALHLLGIFNAASINEFIAKSTVDFTSDTHEIVLSDESIQVVDNNLDAEKLRKLVLKDITLTLPASANTKDVSTPITLAFLDREGSTSRGSLRQFVNVLQAVGAPTTAAAQSLLGRNLKNYGVCGLALSLGLNPAQCRQLFIDADQPLTFPFYVQQVCDAQKIILAGDSDSAFRLKLFDAGQVTWKSLADAGAPQPIAEILQGLGMSGTEAQLAVTDVITTIWWASAMANYANALIKGQPLEKVGKDVVKESNQGYNEPWMILAAWEITGKPEIKAGFTSSLIGAPMVQAAGTAASGLSL
jgi:hypothetical protein